MISGCDSIGSGTPGLLHTMAIDVLSSISTVGKIIVDDLQCEHHLTGWYNVVCSARLLLVTTLLRGKGLA
ncbi:hypothetical protein G6F56_013989 [Rhizopus delemar]|nr:hypothetical protein G6F56_013989 [Rhizopus delemar]